MTGSTLLLSSVAFRQFNALVRLRSRFGDRARVQDEVATEAQEYGCEEGGGNKPPGPVLSSDGENPPQRGSLSTSRAAVVFPLLDFILRTDGLR